jgi:tetratricopeptide (TPR) repeat protein
MATDGAGKFRFAGLARGHYTIAINARGFVPAQQQVDSNLVLRNFLIFELRPEDPDTAALTEVVDARVPPEALSDFERGRAALHEKNIEKALGYLEKALALYPNYFAAQLLLGTTQMTQRRWDEAETALLRAIELDPKSSIAFISLGEVHRQQQRLDDAEKVLLEGLKLDDNSWQGHFTLGRVYWDTGDFQKSGLHIVRTLQLKPDLAEARLIAGNLFLKAGMKSNALIEYEEYLKLAPEGDFAGAARELVQKLKRAAGEKRP